MQAPCCPPNSLPEATAAEAGAMTPLRGNDITLEGGMRCYVAEPAADKLGSDGMPKAAIIVFHDLFGYNSARTHHICDELARDGGYLVVAPDLIGDSIITDPSQLASFRFFSRMAAIASRSRYPYPVIEKKLNEVVVPFVRSKTTGKIGALGFCWGAWAMVRYSSTPNILACGVGPHPSTHLQMLQKSGPKMTEMFEQVTCPMLLCPTWPDPSSLHEDGAYMKILLAKNNGSKCILFTDQPHGFANRSDIRQPNHLKAYKKFMQETLKYFQTYLGGDVPENASQL